VKNVSLYEIGPSFLWYVAWLRLIVDQNLPTFTAQCPREAKSCTTLWRKREISHYEILRIEGMESLKRMSHVDDLNNKVGLNEVRQWAYELNSRAISGAPLVHGNRPSRKGSQCCSADLLSAFKFNIHGSVQRVMTQ
jgi:hypothetical protein